MREFLLAAVVACAARTGERVAASGVGGCGAGDLSAICAADRVELPAARNPLDAPAIDANTTYAVAGAAARERGYLAFEARVTGEHALYAAGAPVRIAGEPPTCTSTAPAESCMRSVASYELVAGTRYVIELDPTAAGERVLVHVHAPAGEEHVVIAAPQRPRSTSSSSSTSRRTPSSGNAL